MTTLQEKIAVMQAAAEGKEIEWAHLFTGAWGPLPTPQDHAYDWSINNYRVKPERAKNPTEVWLRFLNHLPDIVDSALNHAADGYTRFVVADPATCGWVERWLVASPKIGDICRTYSSEREARIDAHNFHPSYGVGKVSRIWVEV